MTGLWKASGSCLLIYVKWWPRNNERFGWISLRWPGLSVPALASPYFSKSIARVDNVEEYHVRKVIIQGCGDRLTIPLKTRLTMTPFKMPRRNITTHRKSQTWPPLRRITTASTRNTGCPTSDGSTAAQPVPLTSVALNRTYDFPWNSITKV